jgi:LPXTG-motif cell wall-anchored protein
LKAVDYRRPTALIAVAALALAGLLAAQAGSAPAAHAASQVSYDSIPAALPTNAVSQPFMAEQTSEFGDLIELAPGTSRVVTGIDVGFSSWACETGSWSTNNCVTTPGTTFTHPVTVNLYAEGTGTVPGALIASTTSTITAPYRPSADATNCTGGKWHNEAGCHAGVLFTAPFDFSATSPTVPDRFIVGVVFNTRGHGPAPVGSVSPADELNVALEGSVTVGADVDPNSVYWNTATASRYGDGGAAGSGVFRKDSAPAVWGTYAPLMIRVTGSVPSADTPPTTIPTPPASAADIPPSTPQISGDKADSSISGDERTLTLDLGPAFANQWYYVTIYSDPVNIGWVWVGPTGSVTFALPDTLPGGTHTVALIDASGVVVAYLPGVSVAALLPATGADGTASVIAGGAALAMLATGAILLMVRRRSRLS